LNIILFENTEVEHPLARADARARHVIEVLRLKEGDTFDAGLIDGPLGKGTLISEDDAFLSLSFEWTKPSPPLYPIHLLIGLPRPQTSRDILRDLTTLGVAAIDFVRSEKGESSYADSVLWKSDEWRKCVINGATQAFSTYLPKITHRKSLAEALANLTANTTKVALDNYEAPGSLTEFYLPPLQPVTVAIGSERGWSASERSALRAAAFDFAHLGTRVLRTETACVAAVTLVRSKLGLL